MAHGVLFGLLLFSQAQALDWYRWRGPDLNGISRETGWSVNWPQEGPRRLWRAGVGTGFSCVSVSQGRLFTVGNSGKQDTIYCFDAATGSLRWRQSHDAPLDAKYYDGGPSATPTVEGDRVYTLSKRGVAKCFEAATGTVVWSKDLRAELGVKLPTWGFAGSPLLEGGVLILNVGSAGTGLDPKSGRVIWKSGTGVAGYSTPVPFAHGGERSVVLFLAESVAALNSANGKELWRHPWETAHDVNAADPIVAGKRIFVSSGYDRGCALIEVAGSRTSAVWENQTLRNHFNSCVLLEGNLYGFDDDTLKCVDLQTGTERWRERTLGKGSLMAADSKLILLSETGELIIASASPSGFRPVARAQVLGGRCWTAPVLSGGRIYCRNAKGDLVCLDVSGPEPGK